MLKNIPLLLIFLCLLSSPCYSSEENQNYLPCLDSSPECIEQLTNKAIANSQELIVIDEKITIIEQRLELMDKRIDHAQDKIWTNYITTDLVELAQNIFGGGGVQRDKIAIADLEVKTADLETLLAQLERQKESQKVLLGDTILKLVLDYESSRERQKLISNQLDNFHKQQQIELIGYRLGQGSTNQYLASQIRGEQLENSLFEVQNQSNQIIRELHQLTGYEKDNQQFGTSNRNNINSLGLPSTTTTEYYFNFDEIYPNNTEELPYPFTIRDTTGNTTD